MPEYWLPSVTGKPAGCITHDDEVRLQPVIDYSCQKSNDSVLLLLGPKGVGKTHLGTSIIQEAGGTFILVEEMIFKYEERRFA